MDVLDSHVHLWDPQVLHYPWLDGLPGLSRRFDLSSWARDGANGPAGDVITTVDGTVPVRVSTAVVVEADCSPAQSLAEVDWVSRLPAEATAVAGIVAAAPLEDGGRLPWHLAALLERPLVRGVRRLFQDEPASFLTAPETLVGARQVAAASLTFDACVRHQQLPALAEFARAVPELRIVLDHLGKPPIAAGDITRWRADLQRLAALPNVYIKLSGARPEARPDAGLSGQALPYVRAALELFGPNRSMFGSDWPVSLLAAPDAEWVDIVFGQALAGASTAELQAVAHGTATTAYRLPQPRTGTASAANTPSASPKQPEETP